MASYKAIRTAFTIPPTAARCLPSGIPVAPFINLAARAHGDAHDHSHGHSISRSDRRPQWSGGVSLTSSGLTLKTFSSKTFFSYCSPTLTRSFLSKASSPTTVHQQRYLHTSPPLQDTPNVPDLSAYRAKSPDTNRALSYFMVGTMGVLSASVAQSTVTGFLETMAASADVLALAKVEVELANIPEGKNIVIKWRGKPVFIRHRTPEEIEEANAVDIKSLRDPQLDADRVKQPEWLVMLGVCTHLGCVPIGEAGDFGGWSVPIPLVA
jgi:ubiquinol-cytochrome c reductase iron-sulfur subunit